MNVFLLPNFALLHLFQVNKIEIHYAKTAKKMDMKKLKQTMWSLLTEFSRKETDIEVTARTLLRSPVCGRGKLISQFTIPRCGPAPKQRDAVKV